MTRESGAVSCLDWGLLPAPAPAEKLNLVGHSGDGIIVNHVANALPARGIKVDNLIVFWTPLSPGTFNAPLPPGVPVTKFVGRYGPISGRLPAGPSVSNIGVDTGSGDAYTAHTSYTSNPVVINTIQGLIRPRQ